MDSDDSEYDSEENDTSKPRLNMKHGFIHHIRRNQIDRDNYDKKQRSTPKHKQQRPGGSKKPEHKLYIPPKRSDHSSKPKDEEEGTPHRQSEGKPLFKLEYTTNDGNIHTILVKKGQDAKKVVRRFANQAGIPGDLLDTLEWKITQEQLKRG